jgi:transcription elongation factor Elf1
MGIKYPLGDTPKYPARDWTCPRCNKYHSKPHYAFPGQIDRTKEPKELGRVKWGREENYADCDKPATDGYNGKIPAKVIKKFNTEKTGDQYKRNGNQKPLFCPHCGWEDTIICIVKTEPQKRKKYGIF